MARAIESAGLVVERCDPGTEGALTIGSGEGLGRVPDPTGSAVLPLPEPRDGLVTLPGRAGALAELEPGARVGVAGRLQSAMLAAHRADLTAVHVEGPEDARAMLEEGRLDGWITPVREARSVGAADWMREVFEPTSWATAAGRGVVVVDASQAADPVRGLLPALDDPGSRAAFAAELETLAALGVAVDAPVGVVARAHGRQLRVRALVASDDGRRLVRAEVSGPLSDPLGVGRRTAEILRARGALELLGSLR